MLIDKKLFPFPTIRYTLKMWARLIQACGRSTRSEKDSSVTYILDAAFNRELSRDTSFIPKYFKDRIK